MTEVSLCYAVVKIVTESYQIFNMFCLNLDTLSALPVSPGMVSFYITQDTQKHPLLPELLAGFHLVVSFRHAL